MTLFTADHESFRESFRAFLDRDVLPGRATWGADSAPSQVLAIAAKSGYLGIGIDERFGGGGVNDLRYGVVIAEETMRAGLTGLGLGLLLHGWVVAPALQVFGTAEQRADWLPQLATGSALATVAMTDTLPGTAGSVINGAAADLVVTTVGGTRVVLGDTVRREETAPTLGVTDGGICDLTIETGAPLDAAAAAQLRADGDLVIALLAVAGARTALASTLAYVRDRHVFGRPVATFENTGHALAEVSVRLETTAGFIENCVRERTVGPLSVPRSAIAVLAATALHARTVDQGLQLHGGYGYMREYPISSAYADARYLRLHADARGDRHRAVADGLGI